MSKLPGSKCMSSSHMPKGSGKMSSAHGLTKNTSPTKGMSNASGRVGAGVRSFKNIQNSTAGYSGGSTAHAKQPK